MHALTLVAALVLTWTIAPFAPAIQSAGAPEAFTANALISGATAPITIEVQRYTPDFDRTTVETALKHGGYPAFVAALRKAPVVGTVSAADQRWSVRWARERPHDTGRTIVLVVDQPIFFVGGGRANAKPREGYEVAVIELRVDDTGRGDGSMAAAARVKPGGETGVRIDDYAEKPIQLVSVTRALREGKW